MIPLSKLEVTKCHVKKGTAGENRHPIKFDHWLHPNHEISRLMATQVCVRQSISRWQAVAKATLALLPNLQSSLPINAAVKPEM